ncbi:hypothetical protein ACFLYT_01670, partial [Nanoarchaeota archaeon]
YSWIYWNWTNPADDDFNTSIIYLNGIWQQNTTSNFYNATLLSPETNYTITVHTQDHYGNINNIDQNSTTATLSDTTAPLINTIADNPDPVEKQQNITITANVTDDINVSLAWFELDSINYTMNQYGDIWNLSLNISTLTPGEFNYTVFANDTNNNPATPTQGNFTIQDTIAPAPITNLDNQSQSKTWIYWTWTNPIDDDFNTSIIYINGAWQINTTDNFYNATSLSAETNYTITVHTQDHYGNINNIDQNSTATTLSDTAPPTINQINAIPDPVERLQDIIISADVTDDGVVSLAWFQLNNINYTMNQYNEIWNLTISTATLIPGQYDYTIFSNDSKDNSAAPMTSNFTVQDTIAPGSVTGLGNQSQGQDWIYWTWTNPGDADFNTSIVYIDGTWKINTTDNFYNATGLITGTNHTITVHTQDHYGNINNVDQNNTASLPSVPIIIYTEFEGKGETTNLSYIGEADTVVAGLILDTGTYGKIEFRQDVTLNSSFNLNSPIEISYASISLEPSIYPTLNTSANLTMRSLQLGYPKILKDGASCTDCTILNWDTNTGELTFNVTSFSTYTAEEANQSKMENNGTTNTTFYLFMKTQFWNSTTSAWVDEDVVVNDTAPRQLNAGSLLKLDLIWNAYNYGSYNLSFGDGTYRVYAEALDINRSVIMNIDGTYINATYNFTLDTTPPPSVTNLANTLKDETWLYWTWTNPTDPDFYQAIIYIDGIWQQNTTNNYFNATGLSNNTNYTITVHTRDLIGNVNNTDQNNTATTLDGSAIPVINSVNATPDPVERLQNITISANVTDTLGVSLAWFQLNNINYTMQQYGDIWNLSINTSTLPAEVHNYTVYANNTISNYATPQESSFTVQDTIFPDSVSGLANQTQDYTWIYWNWTNPTNEDFNTSIIYLNGIWQINTTDNFYNATGLTSDTNYTITVHTQDHSGNINNTDQNSTTKTLSDTTPPIIKTTTAVPDPVERLQNISITANITDDVTVNSAWFQLQGVNYTMQQYGTIWNLTISTSALTPGQYNYTVYSNDTKNNQATPMTSNFTVQDTIPPSSVTGLANQTQTYSWIYWNWTN